MNLRAGVLGLFLIAGCGGGPPAAVTIADLGLYLAQARCPNGGSMVVDCPNPEPQRASDQMAWRRSDGGTQYSDSVISDDGTYWITTWSYPAHGSFVAANGDGGEVYVSDGTAVSICCTQDGGKPGIQRFETWGLFNAYTVSCTQGWTQIDALDRACKATLTYPANGEGLAQIVAETIISEHYSHVNQRGNMERFYFGAGWGRLAWEAYSSGQPRVGMPEFGPFGAPLAPIDLKLTDRRLVTTIVAMPLPLASVTDYGWPPAGFVP